MAKEEKKVTKKPLKVLPKKNFDLSAFKAANKLDTGIKDKPIEWLSLGSAFHKATGLPGFPKGYTSVIRGHSNTGKSTAIILAAVASQRMGILPVIIDTENAWSWERARTMGFEYNEVVDQDTGEVIEYDGFFLYINNDHLIANYGSKVIKNVDEATVEDVAEFCNDLLRQQNSGDLPYELTFLWDSIGTLDCRKGVESNSKNNMWVAGAISTAFKSLITYKIPASRHENKKYTNTFIAVQKIWMQANQVGQPTVKHSGGDFFWYNSRLILHIGGHSTNSIKTHTATSGGKTYILGSECKISVVKCHVTFDGTPLSDNKLVSTEHGYILPKEGVDEYKKTHRKYILEKLQAGENSVISFEEEGSNFEGNDDSVFENM